jgi:hypothetical protein
MRRVPAIGRPSVALDSELFVALLEPVAQA